MDQGLSFSLGLLSIVLTGLLGLSYLSADLGYWYILLANLVMSSASSFILPQVANLVCARVPPTALLFGCVESFLISPVGSCGW